MIDQINGKLCFKFEDMLQIEIYQKALCALRMRWKRCPFVAINIEKQNYYTLL